MPSGNAAEEIESLNNSILYAVANGARFVLVPYLNPSVILAASQYAAEHGAKVLMMPQGAAAPDN